MAQTWHINKRNKSNFAITSRNTITKQQNWTSQSLKLRQYTTRTSHTDTMNEPNCFTTSNSFLTTSTYKQYEWSKVGHQNKHNIHKTPNIWASQSWPSTSRTPWMSKSNNKNSKVPNLAIKKIHNTSMLHRYKKRATLGNHKHEHCAKATSQ